MFPADVVNSHADLTSFAELRAKLNRPFWSSWPKRGCFPRWKTDLWVFVSYVTQNPFQIQSPGFLWCCTDLWFWKQTFSHFFQGLRVSSIGEVQKLFFRQALPTSHHRTGCECGLVYWCQVWKCLHWTKLLSCFHTWVLCLKNSIFSMESDRKLQRCVTGAADWLVFGHRALNIQRIRLDVWFRHISQLDHMVQKHLF